MSTNPIFVLPKNYWSHVNLPPMRERLWIEAGKMCHWCQCPTRLSKGQEWDSTTIDHVIPRYKGGGNEKSNLVAACQRCNNRRSYEDSRGMPEGAMLGKWKVDAPNPVAPTKHVALTGDEKKAIMAGGVVKPKVHAYQAYMDQRDQALKEIKTLRERIGNLESDAHLYRITIKNQDEELLRLQNVLSTTTIWRLLKKKLAERLMR